MRRPKSTTPDLFGSHAPDPERANAPSSPDPRSASGTRETPVRAAADPREPPLDPARLLEGLNPPQVQAVLHERGPLLILAGAGSGKTRVITRRIAHLVIARGLDPSQVLAITFTNKAAGEMRQRVDDLCRRPGFWISTFHSLCARILRREIEVLGGWTRDFSIYDTSDRNQLLKQVVQREGFDSTRFKPSQLGAWISERKNRLDFEDLDIGVDEEAQALGGAGLDAEVLARVWRAYESALRQANALDFDDLLLKTLEIFDGHPGVRDAWSQRFRQVMVDEYQDTNRVQYRLMRHFCALSGNIAVCGDPDQSIYGWRGADVRNILDFEKDFPGAFVVRLEQNYRSSQTILDAAQALIRHNRQRKEKSLWSDRGAGEKLTLLECSDEDEEAREIAAGIRELERQGQTLDGMAIFYRVNFMQRAIERALRLSQIPYQIVAGTEFYQRREIKDLVAWLKLLVNPADGEAAKRALGAPARGIGDKTVELLERFVLDRRVDWATAARSSELRAQVRGRGRAALEAFAALLDRLAPAKDMPALAAISRVVEETDYFRWLDQSAEPGEVDRAANVDELLTYAGEYDAATPSGGLRGFLEDIALVSDTDAYSAGEAKVTLMTLHAAKGLEFPAVFIAGLEEELLPHARALMDAVDPDMAIEEERRLFYVGITRAQQRLFLSRAQVRRHFGEDKFTQPSRFLSELPPNAIRGYEDDPDEETMLGRFDRVEEQRSDLREGQHVVHPHFGAGKLVKLSGAGANARATVQFPGHGEKTLLLAYAKLTRLPERPR